MDIIESRIDTGSEEYGKNFKAMEELVKDLRHELKRARSERSQKSLDRLAESGKLPAEKKLELLLDKNSPFLEIAPLAAKDMAFFTSQPAMSSSSLMGTSITSR